MLHRFFIPAILIGSIVSQISAEENPATTPPVRTETWPLKESFESGIPSYISTEHGKLSIIHDHVQDGKSALRWDYNNESTLTFKTGPLGNVNVYTGYGSYSRSTFTIRAYLPEIANAKLVVEFLAGDQVAGHYDIPMQHKGWQQIVHHYSWHSQIKWTQGNLKKNLDSIRIRVEIPEGVSLKKNYAIFDAIQYNTPRDFRDARNPVTQHWTPKQIDLSKEKKVTPADLKKLAKLETILTPQPNPAIKDEVWIKKIEAYKKRIDKEGYKPGNPIKTILGHYFGFLNAIASDYAKCSNPTYKKQLADLFISVNLWMQDQGLVVNGSTGKANNYIGRTYVDAVFKMRPALIEAKQMDETLAYIKWSYHYDNNFFPEGKPNYNKSMDYFYNEATRLLQVALMHSDPKVRWAHVSKFRSNFSKQLVTTVKPDGSLFHHGMHYFAYAGGAMNSASNLAKILTEAEIPASKEALDSIKLGLMKMRWYAGGTNVVLALCGRHPSGTQNIPTDAYLNLAKAYAPYNQGKWEPSLIAAYLRFKPSETKKEEFKAFQPEPAPNGFVTMPYAGIGSQRRGNWLANVKGFSSFVSSNESYANANRFGLYLSNGFLEILTHPNDLPTVHGSGILPDNGFNWLALDGTTTIHSTLAKIANGNGSFHEKSGGLFNGGLSHDGRNGMFVQKIESKAQAQKSREKGVKGNPFTATKSWFFFDNRIICLGSGISVDHVDFPVRTTLFQKAITDKSSLAFMEPSNDGTCTLMDNYGNAYFTAKGDPVKLTSGVQHSRDGYDKKDTHGNWSTAWIDHGKNPTSASYQYAILVQTNKEDLQSFRTALQSPETSPYLVLQQDDTAHIVFDRKTKTTAYAIFDANCKLPPETNSPLIQVKQPCLVMVSEVTQEDQPHQYLVSLTYPDPRDFKTDSQIISVVLKGDLTASQKLPAGATCQFSEESQTTTLSVPVQHGESHTIKLSGK